ncbi:unnamed protein product [Triticum turgidum subsp. durum]|uniref:Magnesium transporter n=3 Tax=Triticum TaxID=4564 RepID=A0A9R1AZC1_TRITD|nr:unnamed protein product [Triticum turgidum subsp. durum]
MIISPFQDWVSQSATQIATQLCGFVTIVAGTFLLHKTNTSSTDRHAESAPTPPPPPPPPPPDQICVQG